MARKFIRHSSAALMHNMLLWFTYFLRLLHFSHGQDSHEAPNVLLSVVDKKDQTVELKSLDICKVDHHAQLHLPSRPCSLTTLRQEALCTHIYKAVITLHDICKECAILYLSTCVY
jgi:hypothetical protein